MRLGSMSVAFLGLRRVGTSLSIVALDAMEIPSDIYERVLDLATDICNTWMPDDALLRSRLYGELRDYCESVALTGRDHPFLWETLADFTDDDRTAISLYLRSLVLAQAAGAIEYQASICLALAERHVDLGEVSNAYSYALRADEFVADSDDLDLRKKISQLLLDLSERRAGI